MAVTDATGNIRNKKLAVFFFFLYKDVRLV